MILHTLPFLETTAQFQEVFNFFFDKSLLILSLYCLLGCLPQLLLFYFIFLMLILWSIPASAQLSATVSGCYVHLLLVIFWSNSVSAQLSATVSDFYVLSSLLILWSYPASAQLSATVSGFFAYLLKVILWSHPVSASTVSGLRQLSTKLSVFFLFVFQFLVDILFYTFMYIC